MSWVPSYNSRIAGRSGGAFRLFPSLLAIGTLIAVLAVLAVLVVLAVAHDLGAATEAHHQKEKPSKKK